MVSNVSALISSSPIEMLKRSSSAATTENDSHQVEFRNAAEQLRSSIELLRLLIESQGVGNHGLYVVDDHRKYPSLSR